MNIIVAIDSNGGIGKNGKIPWNIPESLKHFRRLTENKTVIMGRKTWDSLGRKPLPNRHNCVISHNMLPEAENYNVRDGSNRFYDADSDDDVPIVKYYKDLESIFYEDFFEFSTEPVFVIGGQSIYLQAFLKFPGFIRNLYVTKIDSNYQCDTFFPIEMLNESPYEVLKTSVHDNIKVEYLKYTYKPPKIPEKGEQQYLSLLKKLILSDIRSTRNAKTYSVFGKRLEFDISESFPLLTTKRVFWRGIVEELLFFLKGQTDATILKERGITIWDGNTSREFLDQNGFEDYPEGQMGPMYGFQWRHYGAKYYGAHHNYTGQGHDQLKRVIHLIKTDPHSRRIIMTDYNPCQAEQGVLYPCHSLVLQFYVEQDKLSCQMYQRSADVFLGLPFNIASTSLLLTIIAHVTGMIPYRVILVLGDAHLYQSHLKPALQQLGRSGNEFPRVSISSKGDISDPIEFIENLKFEDFVLSSYNPKSGIRGGMVP